MLTIAVFSAIFMSAPYAQPSSTVPTFEGLSAGIRVAMHFKLLS